MKRCELCKSTARIYCESDRASLCWTCDTKVHSANFLVAKHARSLLCRVCQSPTHWSASGDRLCRSTASVCENCTVDRVSGCLEEGVGGNVCGEVIVLKSSVDENRNRVVTRLSGPIPPASSSSSSEEFLVGDRSGFGKRKRRNVEGMTHEDDIYSSSVNINHHSQSSMMSSSLGTVGDMMSGEYVHAPIHQRGKSRRTLEFDLNL
ncbi:hypothetical protein M8C21_026385 [Ambrosia artemisiifolia]|uniref:B box-type domain-containing protein n=1 Tax=Ambrosia artemisiifolia TaxID=4212 RepID=A0AAD5BU23_AMBAR|nr:hypothetical protein M8C21_026385 [Ambrosia artemisiifolia]